MSRDYDLIIIGGGPAGYAAAIQASKLGKDAVIVEANEHHIGGNWISTGTLPSKALRETAGSIHRFTSQFGDPEQKKPYERFKMKEVLKYKDQVIANENSVLKANLIRNKVHTVLGTGSISGPHTVEVELFSGETRQLEGEYILIATGSRQKPPEQFTIDHQTIRDTTSILDLHHIPSRLVVIGASAYALEFASTFAALGTRVSVLNDRPDYLTFLDSEIKQRFDACTKSFRIAIYNNTEVEKLDFNPLRNCTELQYRVTDTGETHVIETEQVLYSGQRIPHTGQLGLDESGVERDPSGAVITDREFRSSVSSIFAAGDAATVRPLASAAFAQGRLASRTMFQAPLSDVANEIPFSVFTFPEMAGIGYTKEGARQAGYDVAVGRGEFEKVMRAEISKSREGLLKLIFDASTRKLLGIHIIGEHACELIHVGQTVLSLNASLDYFTENVFNHPTFSEAYRIAAFDGINRIRKAGQPET